MAIPFEGQCADAPEAPGRQLDRLAANEEGFDDVRSQESELDIAPDVARVDPIAPGNLLDDLAYPILRPFHGAGGRLQAASEDLPAAMSALLRIRSA